MDNGPFIEAMFIRGLMNGILVTGRCSGHDSVQNWFSHLRTGPGRSRRMSFTIVVPYEDPFITSVIGTLGAVLWWWVQLPWVARDLWMIIPAKYDI